MGFHSGFKGLNQTAVISSRVFFFQFVKHLALLPFDFTISEPELLTVSLNQSAFFTISYDGIQLGYNLYRGDSFWIQFVLWSQFRRVWKTPLLFCIYTCLHSYTTKKHNFYRIILKISVINLDLINNFSKKEEVF